MHTSFALSCMLKNSITSADSSGTAVCSGTSLALRTVLIQEKIALDDPLLNVAAVQQGQGGQAEGP